MISLITHITIRTKFVIIVCAFLIVAIFSIWGMSEIAKTTRLQKLERDHVEFSTLLYHQSEKYVRLLREGSETSRAEAAVVLERRSELAREKGLLQLLEEMRALQDSVFTATNGLDRVLLGWFGFARAFELAGQVGPESIEAMQTFLRQLEDQEISFERFESGFLDEVVYLGDRSSEFSPLVNDAGLFVRNLVVVLDIILLSLTLALLYVVFIPILRSIRYFIEATTVIADGDLDREIVMAQHDEIGDLARAFRSMQSKIHNVAQEIATLTQAIQQGQLKSRANAETFRGGWRELIEEVNHLIEAFVAPITATGVYIDRISKGDIPDRITAEYKGEFNGIKTNLNRLIETMNRVATVAQDIAGGNLAVKLERRSEQDALMKALEQMIVYLRTVATITERISKNDLQVDVRPQSKHDELNHSLQRMVNSLQTAMDDTEHSMAEVRQQNWLRTGLAELSNLMRGEQDARTLSKNVITYLAKYLDVPVGALYRLRGQNGESRLQLAGSYAYLRRKGNRHEFRLGESMVGQAALEKEQIMFANIPPEYLAVGSGLGGSTPRHVLVTPFLYERDVKGVIELASVQEFSSGQREFLEQATENIGIAFQTVDNRTQLQELLGATQQQAEELQQQQEELRQTNEELGEQTQALQLSESRLQQQQEELRQTNEELEEQTRELVKQQDEVKEKNRALEQASNLLETRAKDLEIASKYKSEFLANMSHELRTPLNSMLILSNLLAQNKEQNLTDKQVEFARTVHTSGQELLTLINEVLDLSKVEAGRMELNLADMNLHGLASYINQHFAHVAKEKDLYLKIDVADNLPASIYTDRQRIEQIVKNFLSNAFKFTSEGGITLRISRPDSAIQLLHRTLTPQRAIAIAVADTGIGIPKDKQRLIFEAFQQADGSTSRQYGGTGLGLSISREMAKLLGGEIQLHSEEGSGSTFTLFLPEIIENPPETTVEDAGTGNQTGKHDMPDAEDIAPQPEKDEGGLPPESLGDNISAERETPPSEHRPAEVERIRDDRRSTQPGDKCLLIIEDDPKFAAILFDLARDRGFKVLVAGDGSAGLQLAYQYVPSAIILDIGLPGTDGWVVQEKLHANPETEHVPVYMISANDAPSKIEQQGILGYLTKPVSPEALDEVFHAIETYGDGEDRCAQALVVEDNEVMRTSLAELLNEHISEVTTAATGDDAITLLQQGTFTCLVLDLGLPDMSGFDFLDRVSADDAIPPLHIIVYTGRELTKDEDRQLQRYTHSVIIKGAKSADRLLDEMTLLLHQVERELPQNHQTKPKVLHDKDAVLESKTILVVDDDVRNVYALANVLDDKGLNIITAENGIQALEELDTNADEIDLVLMDIMMPEMDGYEAMREIRKQPRFHKLPILALTAKAMKGDRRKCLEAGANDYLSKPIDTEKLFSLLRVWLY